MIPVFLVLIAAAALLFVIEFAYIARGEPTISARLQKANAQMGVQLVAGIMFTLGVLAGWFIGHFTSPPPVY
jgi:4-hydroxybenzoate polyprenyltransferase